ncbi:hypothetical protein OGAPHI_000426 [Ogataea philodendri]|uniref:Transcription regulator Rua1 C-terminal domain-containing protein n=1 Tax=Ogataea philodendri TaxID=1378263 RepID=A0A9P8TB35_9ASCO|nr:uncharacterized protein OGAPHI_000426 [Ogataea philodendri]KAH3671721.1 hypothetical protein OGAPHI_000426 [Ogataea philodendri]
MEELVNIGQLDYFPQGDNIHLHDQASHLKGLEFSSAFLGESDASLSYLTSESHDQNKDQDMFDLIEQFTTISEDSYQKDDLMMSPDNEVFDFPIMEHFNDSDISLNISPTSSISHDNDYVYTTESPNGEQTPLFVSMDIENPETIKAWESSTPKTPVLSSPAVTISQVRQDNLSGGHYKGTKKTKYSGLQTIFNETDPDKLNHWLDLHFNPYIQPNGITFNYFRKVSNEDEYIYKRNPKAEFFLPPRYSSSNANYYEPLVVRYKKSHQERGQGDGEGLCPYCKSDDINDLFFERKDSNYLHHVTKLHGVYSNGMEMPFPSLIGEALEIKRLKTRGRTERKVHSVECEKCHETIKIQQLDCEKEGNKFLAYFRHMLVHNEKKNAGKRNTKISLSSF